MSNPWETGASREHGDDAGECADSPFAVDRSRIIHSAAFRRLQAKAQVFVAVEGDHFRTRLTHTLEVADLAQRIARRLGLRADLAEVVALAHDLGHPPFGHAGERALAACMSSHGGFEHNQQSLRVVEWLEHPYPQFRGLNLTRAVRECLAKHETRYDHPADHPLRDGTPPPQESRVVDLADRLAYGMHDLQDGLYAGLIRVETLADVDLWRESALAVCGEAAPAQWRGVLRPIVDRIERGLIAAVAADSPGGCARLSPAMDAALDALERLLRDELYRHPTLVAADRRAARMLTVLFEHFVHHPEDMGERFAARSDDVGLHRAVADYVAGMTDRFCLAEHARLVTRPA